MIYLGSEHWVGATNSGNISLFIIVIRTQCSGLQYFLSLAAPPSHRSENMCETNGENNNNLFDVYFPKPNPLSLLNVEFRVKHGQWACFCNGQLMYVVWAFIVILLFLHFDLSEIIAFAHYTSTASPLQKHAHYPCFTLLNLNTNFSLITQVTKMPWHTKCL